MNNELADKIIKLCEDYIYIDNSVRYNEVPRIGGKVKEKIIELLQVSPEYLQRQGQKTVNDKPEGKAFEI